MKANNLFLAGVAALSLGMTACNNEDVPQVNNPGEGTTFAGMYISSMKDLSTRAVNDKQEDYGGRTEESKLTELQLLSNVLPQTWTLGTAADETGKFWETQTATIHSRMILVCMLLKMLQQAPLKLKQEQAFIFWKIP